MSPAILATKLFIPPPGSCLVERVRLSSRLDACLRSGCRLALISAPAGFGKTTLLSAWIRGMQAKHAGLAAWLSLDEQDNDAKQFWSYVVAAFQTVIPHFGKEAQLLLSKGPLSSLEPVLTILINALASTFTPVLLVLDDFHLIDLEPIFQSLAYLLDRIPPNVHLLILTRADPPLPLACYRSRDQLLEIRLTDLRFSLEEAQEFFNTKMGLELASPNIESLHAKTEGWIAGLQMASISLWEMTRDAAASQSRDPVADFVEGFSGSNRYILDYLLDEVLRRQPAEIQAFLLTTSILETLCGSLCDALLESSDKGPKQQNSLLSTLGDSQGILEYLEQENLFLLPLDAERCWFRYHSLFADLLLKRLLKINPNGVEELHTRASRWYQDHQYFQPAVEHAFQAQDMVRAGQILEEAGESILKHGEYHWLLQWIEKLPEAQIHRHWKLFLYQAMVYASLGQLNQAECCLKDFERYRQEDLSSAPLADWLTGQAAAVQALIAIFRADRTASRRYAELALKMIPKGGDTPWRTHLLIALSHLNQMEGQLEVARQNLLEAMEAGRQAGDSYMTLDTTAHLMMTLYVQGQLQQASRLAQQGLQFIEQYGLSNTPEASMVFLAWGYILCEQHRLAEAEAYIARGFEMSRRANIPGMLGWAYQVQMRYCIASEDLIAAEESTCEGAQLVQEVEMPAWIADGISAFRAEVWIRQGNLPEAEVYLKARRIQPVDPLPIGRYTLYAALGRLLLAKGELDAAERLIQQLRQQADAASQQRMVITALIQLALLEQCRGNQQQAVQNLDCALELAGPERYLQVFLDEGQTLVRLLTCAASQGKQASFARELLTLRLDRKDLLPESEALAISTTLPGNGREEAGLSPREIEVLRLLAEGLSNKEISQRLFISLRTVKYHATNIFTKLNVENRTQAVIQAKAARLFNQD